MVVWAFRLMVLLAFVWAAYDPRSHRENWLLLTACICFYVLGVWMVRRKRAKGD
jgi:cytochrome c-type biogenesis protein CcmH/NrfF